MSPIRIFHIIGSILFAIFAYLQFNDVVQYDNHDAWIWIALYGTASLANIYALKANISIKLLYLWTGFLAGSLLFRMQDDRGNLHLDWLNPALYWDPDGNQMVQQTNESGGLVILLIWAALQLYFTNKANTQPLP